MARALCYDGLLPDVLTQPGTCEDVTPDHLRLIIPYIAEHRTAETPFDIVVQGTTPGDNPAQAAGIVRPFADAGATWWIEAQWDLADTMWSPETQERIRERIRQGPPSIR